MNYFPYLIFHKAVSVLFHLPSANLNIGKYLIYSFLLSGCCSSHIILVYVDGMGTQNKHWLSHMAGKGRVWFHNHLVPSFQLEVGMAMLISSKSYSSPHWQPSRSYF